MLRVETDIAGATDTGSGARLFSGASFAPPMNRLARLLATMGPP